MEVVLGAADDSAGKGNTLAVSIVTFHPDLLLLQATLEALSMSISAARATGSLSATRVWVIDNTPSGNILPRIREAASRALEGVAIEPIIRHGQGNIGYGRAHNLALLEETYDYHLVLNPDVELEEAALIHALGFMRIHPEVGLLAPSVSDGQGRPQYLCKRFPAVSDLLMRGFAPDFLKRIFAKRLADYEMRDIVDAGTTVTRGIPIVSGACMFVRRPQINTTHGFDPQFFLYFEDFDWSIRLGQIAANAWVPSVRVVHHGGGAAKKGTRHICMFAASAWRFYRKYGWKFV